jgi:hypothetical protein
MKTTFLLFSGLFLSVASFAQTSVKNSSAVSENSRIQNDKAGSQVNHSTSISSATNIQSDAANNVKSKSSAEIKKGKKSLATEKQKASAEAKDAKKAASTDETVSTSAHLKVNASGEHNKLSNNASLNGNGTASSSTSNEELHLKKEAKATVKTQADEAVKNTSKVKANVNKTTIKTGKQINTVTTGSVHTGVAAAHSVKVKPVSIKTGATVKTNNGIKIR